MSTKVDLRRTTPSRSSRLRATATGFVKARGYWELVWIRFKRDRLAVASIVFIVFLLLSAFVGAPICRAFLGHGPNDIFPNGVDPNTFAPVGPWTHITALPGREPGHTATRHATFLPLGGDSQLGRDLFLRLLYGAQTSLEVASSRRSARSRSASSMGLLAGYFRGWVDTVVSRMIEIVMVFPVAALHHRRPDRRRARALNQITFGFLVRASSRSRSSSRSSAGSIPRASSAASSSRSARRSSSRPRG